MGADGKYYTLMQAVYGYGLKIIGSSSLLQANIFQKKFDESLGKSLGTNDFNDVITALQFARSSSVVSSLFGAIDPQHVEDNLLLAYLPKADKETISKLYGENNVI